MNKTVFQAAVDGLADVLTREDVATFEDIAYTGITENEFINSFEEMTKALNEQYSISVFSEPDSTYCVYACAGAV